MINKEQREYTSRVEELIYIYASFIIYALRNYIFLKQENAKYAFLV